MKSERFIIAAAAVVALFSAGAYATYPASLKPASEPAVSAMKADEGVPHNLVTAMKPDEGVPHNLVMAMKSDEGVPQNLITAMKADEGVPHNLVTSA